MRIKAVLMDMDGTLLGKSQVAVSERNMSAVQRAIEKGVQVIPCTGCVCDMLPPSASHTEGNSLFRHQPRRTCFGEDMEAFLKGNYAGKREKENIAYFETLLPSEPAWKRG